jgi:hypothetical protein
MRLALLAAIVALVALPAYAQGFSKGHRRAGPTQDTAEQKKKGEAIDKNYKSAIQQIPEQKYDPWGHVRGGQPVKK